MLTIKMLIEVIAWMGRMSSKRMIQTMITTMPILVFALSVFELLTP